MHLIAFGYKMKAVCIWQLLEIKRVKNWKKSVPIQTVFLYGEFILTIRRAYLNFNWNLVFNTSLLLNYCHIHSILYENKPWAVITEEEEIEHTYMKFNLSRVSVSLNLVRIWPKSMRKGIKMIEENEWRMWDFVLAAIFFSVEFGHIRTTVETEVRGKHISKNSSIRA